LPPYAWLIVKQVYACVGHSYYYEYATIIKRTFILKIEF